MPISKRRLRPRAVDAKARQEAKKIAEDWQSAGLAVDLVEYFATETETGGYGLTGRSSDIGAELPLPELALPALAPPRRGRSGPSR